MNHHGASMSSVFAPRTGMGPTLYRTIWQPVVESFMGAGTPRPTPFRWNRRGVLLYDPTP